MCGLFVVAGGMARGLRVRKQAATGRGKVARRWLCARDGLAIALAVAYQWAGGLLARQPLEGGSRRLIELECLALEDKLAKIYGVAIRNPAEIPIIR